MRRSFAPLCILLITLSLACRRAPADARFEAPLPKVLYSSQTVSLPPVVVLDRDGDPIAQSDPSAEVQITATPPGIVMVSGRTISPLQDGAVTLELTVRGAAISKKHPLQVRLLDRVTLACDAADCVYSTGSKFRMRASFFGRGQVAPEVEPTWSVDQENIAKHLGAGTFEAMASGKTKIRVSVGEVSAAQEIKVFGTEAPDRLQLSCPLERQRLVRGERRCWVRLGEALKLSISASRQSRPVLVPDLEASSEDINKAVLLTAPPTVMGKGMGLAKVQIKAGGAKDSMQIEVRPPKCDPAFLGTFQYVFAPGVKLSLECNIPEATQCLEHFVPVPKQGEEPGDDEMEQLKEAMDSCCCKLILYVP